MFSKALKIFSPMTRLTDKDYVNGGLHETYCSLVHIKGYFVFGLGNPGGHAPVERGYARRLWPASHHLLAIDGNISFVPYTVRAILRLRGKTPTL
jgi:hypothetical protein